MSFYRNEKNQIAKNGDSWMLHRQLTEHAAGMRASAAGNMVNGTAVLVVFAHKAPVAALLLGYLLLIGLVTWRFTMSKAIGALTPQSTDLEKTAKRVTANAICLGAFWGTCAGLLVTWSQPEYQIFGIAIATGMMSTGPISYRTLESAALGYLYAAVPGCIAGLFGIGNFPALAVGVLLICFVVVLTVNIKISARHFMENTERERALEKSSDTIQLLLNDYAEQGADWLIELAAGERIVQACPRLAEASGRQIETLNGKRLTSLFDPGPEVAALEDHLASGRAFRQHIVSLTIDGEQRWWSINARPTFEKPILYRGVITDITAQRRAEERVSYMAHFDGLTDLPNRFTFGDELYRALKRNNGVAGLMCLDLDEFKGVNDTLGHPIGDQLLQQVARRLEACISKQEIVGRMGGDEFAILVRANHLDRIDTLAEKIIGALSQPFAVAGHELQIGVSIGIAKAPEHATTFESLFSKADLALYAAKGSGRNRAVHFEPGMDVAAEQRRQLEMDLRRALSDNELMLFYQPIVEAGSSEVTAYEALVRWDHPTRGTVMPGEFISIAEENGMIVQLGEWVIRQALDDLATWPDPIGISINLSPAQMRSPNLISTIVNALARTQTNPKRVCLEITESVLLHDSEANIETLHKLRSLGIGIALDDFGTGYSSLNYLRSFPFDKIKIDRCFVEDIDQREDCQAIVRSVVNLAKSLGMTTIAEGVERVEQANQLMAEGCSSVQGFLYSKALPVGELTDLREPKPKLDERLFKLEEERRKASYERSDLRAAG
jgi:diguanylate cyclase (GGDEF)-like protein/PAS domain S-box-containing protein